MKDKNPVSNVDFWSNSDYSKKFTLKSTDISLLIPSKFSEKILRLFVKDKCFV